MELLETLHWYGGFIINASNYVISSSRLTWPGSWRGIGGQGMRVLKMACFQDSSATDSNTALDSRNSRIFQ